MRYLWSLLCSRAIIDKGTNKLSLIDIEELVIASELPPPSDEKIALAVSFVVAAQFWYGEDDDEPVLDLRLVIRGPNGQSIEAAMATIGDVNKPKNSSVRLVLSLNKLPFFGLGVYEFEIQSRRPGKVRWQLVGSQPLVLNLDPAFAATSQEQLSEHSPAAPPESS